MSINGTISLGFNLNDLRTVATGTEGSLPVNPLGVFATYADGVGALQVNQAYGNLGTFSGTTAVLNLATGLSDAYGTNVTLARFKGILIQNTSAVDNIVVGGGSDALSTFLNSTGTITLPPGAAFAAFTPDATGWVVTPSTAMNLLLTGTSGQTYTVAVAGGKT